MKIDNLESAEVLMSDAEVKEELKDLLSVAIEKEYIMYIVDSIYDEVIEELGASDRHSLEDVRDSLSRVLVKRLVG